MASETTTAPGLTRHQLKLLIYLSAAAFFEGYDFIALIQVLPRVVEEMALDEANTGWLVGFINVGAIMAFVVIRLADRYGRRRMLAFTIAGYTITSLLTALCNGPWSLGFVQMLARIFLLSELAISVIYAAEEFPAERRGRALGLLQAMATMGAICCAGLAPVFFATSMGWRLIYLVGAIPLVLVAFARRGLRETRAFEEQRARSASTSTRRSPFRIVRGAYRRRMFLMAVIWGFTYLCAQVLVTFWNVFAVQERGLSFETVSKCIMIAALLSMPMVFLVGRLLEIGRRIAAVVIYGTLILGTAGCYSWHATWALTASLTMAMFAVTGVVPLLNAYNAELFPTEIRANAYAWSNNLLGRVAYVIAPIVVGQMALRVGYGPAVVAMAAFPTIALYLILTRLPETTGISLEETSRLVPTNPGRSDHEARSIAQTHRSSHET